MKEIIKYIYSDNKKIFTRLMYKKGIERMPLAIFSHGLGAHYRQEQRMQEELVNGGIAVLSFDFSGGAGFVESKSEGSNMDMSVFTEMVNLRDIIKYADTLPMVDTKKLYLIGSSQGGIVSMMVAREMLERIEQIFLLYPALLLFVDGHERYATREEITNTTNLHGVLVGKKYFLEIHGMDVYEEIGDVSVPVHIFHGTEDPLVPLKYAEEAVERLPNAKLTIIDKGGHGFRGETQNFVGKEILKEILKKKNSN